MFNGWRGVCGSPGGGGMVGGGVYASPGGGGSTVTGGGVWGVSSRCRVQQGDSCREEAVPEPAGPGT